MFILEFDLNIKDVVKNDGLARSHIQRQEKMVKVMKRNTICSHTKGKKKGFNVLLRENTKSNSFTDVNVFRSIILRQ